MSSSNQTESNNTAISDPIERRRNVRFPFSSTVEVVETKSGTKVIGRTSDLGLGGCYVDTLSPFPPGTEAKIKIIRENETFEAHVRVAYSSIGMGMGLAFVSADQKHVRLFQRWVGEISGNPLPAEEVSRAPPAAKTHTFKNVVLSELIMTLMQKKILTEPEGKDLLRILFR